MVEENGYRRTWRLWGLLDEYLVVRGMDVRASDEKNRIAPHAVPWRLRGFRGDFAAERTLLDIYESLGGMVRLGSSTLEHRFQQEQVWAEVEEAFSTERLVLLQVPRPVFAVPKRERSEAAWEDESTPTSWVGLQLEDEDGEPVAGQRVRLKLADGSIRESVSDERGRLRLDGIPVGNCQVEFVGIDGSDWRAA